MGCFPVMVAAELRKLRGTALLPIGAVSGAAAIGISLYLAAADTTTAYTFPLFAGNVIANTMEELLPFTAALVVGQMMERERSCGTLKNILAVPVSFRRLLAAKLAAGAWLVVLYALLQWGLSLAACALLGLPGLTGGSAAWALDLPCFRPISTSTGLVKKSLRPSAKGPQLSCWTPYLTMISWAWRC